MPTTTIFCWRCGKPIPATARFCPLCGAVQQQVTYGGGFHTTLRILSVAAVVVSVVTLLPLLELNGRLAAGISWLIDSPSISFPGMAIALVRLAFLPTYLTGDPIGVPELLLGLPLILALPTLAIVRSSIACFRAFHNQPSSVPSALATSLIIFVLMIVLSVSTKMTLVPTFFCLAGLIASAGLLIFSLASSRLTRVPRRVAP